MGNNNLSALKISTLRDKHRNSHTCTYHSQARTFERGKKNRQHKQKNMGCGQHLASRARNNRMFESVKEKSASSKVFYKCEDKITKTLLDDPGPRDSIATKLASNIKILGGKWHLG